MTGELVDFYLGLELMALTLGIVKFLAVMLAQEFLSEFLCGAVGGFGAWILKKMKNRKKP